MPTQIDTTALDRAVRRFPLLLDALRPYRDCAVFERVVTNWLLWFHAPGTSSYRERIVTQYHRAILSMEIEARQKERR